MAQTIVADLHNHTTASDGEYTPEQLVAQAEKLGIQAIGVTDHDTLSGLKRAVAAGEKYKVEVIPGVEISICFKRPYFTGTLHLLAYFKPGRLLDDQFVRGFQTILSQGRGEKLVRARIDEINRVFGPNGESPLLKRELVFEDIAVLSDNATRRHFAIALTQTFGVRNAVTLNAMIGNDSPAYLPSGIKLETVAGFMQDNHIFCALAHPAAGSFPGKGHYKEVLPPLSVVEKILPEFIDAGIKGLEVYYPGHTEEHETLMMAWAKEHHLVATGGSDCHDTLERPTGVRGLTQSDYTVFKRTLT